MTSRGGMVIAKLLDTLGLRRLPPPADPVFRLKKFYSFETPYWEAEAEFEPVGRVVEVLVECPRSGASPGQHDFFAELARRYSEVLSAAHRMLAAETTRADFANAVPSAESLRLVCISLSDTPPKAEWELSFEDREGVHAKNVPPSATLVAMRSR